MLSRKCHLGYIQECSYNRRLVPRRKKQQQKTHFCYAGNVHWFISGNAIITVSLVLGRNTFVNAGNVTWVISGNGIITEGLVLGRNTFVMQVMSLGLYLGMVLLRKAWA